MRAFGPIQILVIGFENAYFKGEVLAELRELRERDLVRLVDLVVVRKGEDGILWSMEASELDRAEATEFGALASALVGLGPPRESAAAEEAVNLAVGMTNGRVFTDDEVWHVADAIPPGFAAAVALLEHRWATSLRDAIVRAGGTTLADTWLHPADLMAFGDIMSGMHQTENPGGTPSRRFRADAGDGHEPREP